MAVDVCMPKMGESITEGTILEWKKQVGESINKDETLLEISTDKVDSEIPSPAAGTIVEIIAQVNDTIPVGEVIARIGSEGEQPSADSGQKIETANETEPVTQQQEPVAVVEKESVESTIPSPNIQQSQVAPTSSGDRFYSPLVKSIAKKEGISIEELDAINGSGKNGRVNKHDILSFIENRAIAPPKSEPIKKPPVVQPTPVQTGAPIPTPIATQPMGDKVEPMSRMRKKIADHMVASVQTSPHVYTTVEADVTNLVQIRSELKESFKTSSGVNLTYTPMILDSCIRTIKEFPLMNASLDGDNIVHHGNINMGVAVALPDDNLIVPVIHASEEKNFFLKLKARKGEPSQKPSTFVDSQGRFFFPVTKIASNYITPLFAE